MKSPSLIFAIQPCAPQNVGPENKYGIDPQLVVGGWAEYIADNVLPEIEWMEASGLRPRVLVHNPFCVRAGEMYQFDQYLHARNAGLVTVKDFESAWRPITARAEVIAYMGTLHGDKDFISRTKIGKLDDFARRSIDSVAPILNVGNMSIGFDAANNLPVGEPEYESLDFISALAREHGGRSYIEPIAEKNYPHLFSWPSITTEALWQVRADNWFPDLTKVSGEIVRWASYPIGGWGGIEHNAKGLLPIFRSILSDGHTPCGATTWFRQWGMTASEVLDL